jgi:hypothetical protein
MYQAEIDEIERKLRKTMRLSAISGWSYFTWTVIAIAVGLLTSFSVLRNPQLSVLVTPDWWFYGIFLLIWVVLYWVNWSYKEGRKRLERIAAQDARAPDEESRFPCE